MKRSVLKSLLCALVGTGLMGLSISETRASNEGFVEAVRNGVVRIGVQGANKPFSFRDSDGTMKGIDIDLSHSIAKAMGVKLDLIVVTSANRMEFLEQGKIDIMMAGMYDTLDRRKKVAPVLPGYWSTGPTLMAQKGVIKSWDDIAGKPVCGKQGVLYNKAAETKYKARIIAFTESAEAKEALRSKRCVAFIYENALIHADLTSGDWNDYEMPVSILFDNPWVGAVKLEDQNGIWGTFMSGLAYRWQASGYLLELEQKWGLKPTPWLKEQHEKHKWDDSYLNR